MARIPRPSAALDLGDEAVQIVRGLRALQTRDVDDLDQQDRERQAVLGMAGKQAPDRGDPSGGPLFATDVSDLDLRLNRLDRGQRLLRGGLLLLVDELCECVLADACGNRLQRRGRRGLWPRRGRRFATLDWGLARAGGAGGELTGGVPACAELPVAAPGAERSAGAESLGLVAGPLATTESSFGSLGRPSPWRRSGAAASRATVEDTSTSRSESSLTRSAWGLR